MWRTPKPAIFCDLIGFRAPSWSAKGCLSGTARSAACSSFCRVHPSRFATDFNLRCSGQFFCCSFNEGTIEDPSGLCPNIRLFFSGRVSKYILDIEKTVPRTFSEIALAPQPLFFWHQHDVTFLTYHFPNTGTVDKLLTLQSEARRSEHLRLRLKGGCRKSQFESSLVFRALAGFSFVW